MGQICVKLLLADQNNCSVYVVNRSANKTKALLAANVRHLDKLHVVEDFAQRHEIAASCDAVIVAASAGEFLLTPQGFRGAGYPIAQL
jgi:glutamyl-tRNA reductase